jgi:hypothetical protein
LGERRYSSYSLFTSAIDGGGNLLLLPYNKIIIIIIINSFSGD